MTIPYAETPYGFDYGAAKVQRICSDDRRGWIVIEVKSPKHMLRINVTKTGKMRLWLDGSEVSDEV